MMASLRLKPFSAIMAPPFLRFQTEELRIWTIQRNAESDEKPGSVLYIENRFKSVGIGESEIVYMHIPKSIGFSQSLSGVLAPVDIMRISQVLRNLRYHLNSGQNFMDL